MNRKYMATAFYILSSLYEHDTSQRNTLYDVVPVIANSPTRANAANINKTKDVKSVYLQFVVSKVEIELITLFVSSI